MISLMIDGLTGRRARETLLITVIFSSLGLLSFTRWYLDALEDAFRYLLLYAPAPNINKINTLFNVRMVIYEILGSSR